MLQITRVDVVDDWTLDIKLSNGHLILFDMRRLMKFDPTYEVLQKFEYAHDIRTLCFRFHRYHHRNGTEQFQRYGNRVRYAASGNQRD